MEDGEDKESKTEEPTQKKLDDALKKGQVANSKEVTSFFIFLLLTIIAIWIIPSIMNLISVRLRFLIENAGSITVDQGTIYELLSYYMKRMILYISPIFIGIIIAIFFSSFFQIGSFIFTTEQLKFDIGKLSLLKGFNRIVSIRSFVEFLKGIFKILLVGSFVTLVILADVKELSQYQELSVAGIMFQLQSMIYHILILVTIIMAAIAGVDFAYQKYQHYTSLKMTKQEVKEEYKQSEGSPEIKQKIRQLRYNQSQKRIKQTVPEATVIITNPEHYAVALKFDIKTMDAPVLVAKGLDLVAAKIKEIASDNSIPIVESPPLARALFKDIEIGNPITEEYFEAVAKVISYVMSLDEQRREKKMKSMS